MKRHLSAIRFFFFAANCEELPNLQICHTWKLSEPQHGFDLIDTATQQIRLISEEPERNIKSQFLTELMVIKWNTNNNTKHLLFTSVNNRAARRLCEIPGDVHNKKKIRTACDCLLESVCKSRWLHKCPSWTEWMLYVCEVVKAHRSARWSVWSPPCEREHYLK